MVINHLLTGMILQVAVAKIPRPAHAKAAAARSTPVRPEPKARPPEPSDDEAVGRFFPRYGRGFLRRKRT